MANLTKREFDILDLSGQRYLEWRVDALAHLQANGLLETIAKNNNTSLQDKAKAIIFLRHHVNESLKSEYLLVEDPKELWESLNKRYGHQEKVLLPKPTYDWTNLRFQDFKSVSDYNSSLFRITSQLRLCGQKISEENILDKTFSTMHASNVLLQQQYRERGFTKYSALISVLLKAEQNNELLMKNHNMRPTGSAPPETNSTHRFPGSYNQGDNSGYIGNRRRRNGRGRGRGRGRGCGRSQDRGYAGYQKQQAPEAPSSKGNDKQQVQKGPSGSSQKSKSPYYRCGMTGHWARVCRTTKHLVDLYQASQKGKGKNVESNFIDETPSEPSLDIADFFADTRDGGDFGLEGNVNF